MVLTASSGIAVTSARNTWLQVTTPGERLSETSSASGPILDEAG